MKIWDLLQGLFRPEEARETPPTHQPPVVDEDLLPKPRRRSTWDRYKNPMISGDKGARRFSESMRTRDVQNFARLSQPDKLKAHGLPPWKLERDVARALNMGLGWLWWLASYRRQDRISHYTMFRIPKRSGGTRVIMAPKKHLRTAQRTLLPFFAKLAVSEHAHGFRRGRSTATNARPHVGKRVVVRIDLEDFFGSVTFPRVRGLLMAHGFGYEVATCLALLTTESPRQPVDLGDHVVYTPVGPRACPQGAPTSPVLCNAIARKMDHRLAGLARSLDLDYTRYADDLTFSGDLTHKQLSRLLGQARSIIEDEGFAINRKKTRVMRRGGRQEVAGVCVNETLGLSRGKRRALRARIHQYKKTRKDPAELASIQGHISYLRSLNPAQADALQAYLDRA